MVSLTGDGFTPASIVTIADRQIPSQYISPTTIAFQSPALPFGTTSVRVTVTNVGLGGGVSSSTLPVGITYDAAARFLQQASWGATPALVAHVQQVGFEGYLDEQFASSEDSYTSTNFQWVAEFFWWAADTHEQSQLRTKVGWAWYKLFNSPGTTVAARLSAIPNITNRDAFGSFGSLLTDVSLNINMGYYFNYCCWNYSQALTGKRPDENFAREVMQQFSVGPYVLSEDGSIQMGADGTPLSSYSQVDVMTVARAMTGLNTTGYAADTDPEGLIPMISGPSVRHDSASKELLGEAIPAGLDAQEEVRLVLKQLSTNPNTGRHLSKYLIHELVTSNPSPDYVKRVAAVWANNGAGVQGDLQSVLKAILLDPEARSGDDPSMQLPSSSGRMRDPINYGATLMRNFGAVPRPGIALMGPAMTYSILSHERVWSAPSVFSYYSDYYGLSGSDLLAPEAQLYTSDGLLARAKFAAYVFGLPGVTAPQRPSVDWSTWEPLAKGDGEALLDAWNHLCFHGRMSPQLRTILRNNLQSLSGSDLLTRVEQTAYLIAMSPEYMIED